MDKIIKELEELKLHHERVRGSQKTGLASSFWDGRAQGVADAIAILRVIQSPPLPSA